VSNHFTIDHKRRTVSLHYDKLNTAQMISLGEKLIANATLMDQMAVTEEYKALDVIKETIQMNVEAVQFSTSRTRGRHRPIYVLHEDFENFLEDCKKIPAIALDRGDDILLNGVYHWRTNHGQTGKGLDTFLHVPATEWDDFIAMMEKVAASVKETWG
jgi:hypothetical protein